MQMSAEDALLARATHPYPLPLPLRLPFRWRCVRIACPRRTGSLWSPTSWWRCTSPSIRISTCWVAPRALTGPCSVAFVAGVVVGVVVACSVHRASRVAFAPPRRSNTHWTATSTDCGRSSRSHKQHRQMHRLGKPCICSCNCICICGWCRINSKYLNEETHSWQRSCLSRASLSYYS